MTAEVTSAESISIDAALVRRLVDAQFPQWSDLPIRPVRFDGWDNRTFHLGEQMTVRLPSAATYALQVEKEQRWLPKLAPLLPLTIPTPLAMGAPTEDYPWPWSIYRWIDGDTAAIERIADLDQFATGLAEFLVALQQIDATGGPAPGPHNFFRGGSPAYYDREARQAIATLGDRIDGKAATAVWEAALAAEWHGTPVWFHGDVSHGNLLVKDGKLSAVIDFGTSGVGDPACDLYIAWTFLDRQQPRCLPRRAAARRRDLGARARLDLVESADRPCRVAGHRCPRGGKVAPRHRRDPGRSPARATLDADNMIAAQSGSTPRQRRPRRKVACCNRATYPSQSCARPAIRPNVVASVTDRTRANEPCFVLTGHTLMVDDLGRTELAAEAAL